MKQLTRHVEIEIERRGSNHGLVTTSDGLVLIDGPHKPSDTLRLRAEIERRGLPLRYILNTEPHGGHWTSHAHFDVPAVAHEGVRVRILGTDMAAFAQRVDTLVPGHGPVCDKRYLAEQSAFIAMTDRYPWTSSRTAWRRW